MKFLLLTFSFLFMFTACRSGDPIGRELRSQSSATGVSSDPQVQYRRAISMVNESTELSTNQKNRLTDVIGEYAIKDQNLKLKEAQYRAVLVNEMMDTKNATTLKPKLARQGLLKIHEEHDRNLKDFIEEFKSVVGESTAANNQAILLQVINI